MNSSKIALIALCLLYVVLELVYASVELREDFSGSGDSEIISNYYGHEDHVNTIGAEKLIYGHIWRDGDSFSGLKASGKKVDYYVTDSAHSLRVLAADHLNVTAQMKLSVEGDYNTTQTSLFTAEGNGRVRELVRQPGIFGRPDDLLSLWHNGTFKLNSSVRVQS